MSNKNNTDKPDEQEKGSSKRVRFFENVKKKEKKKIKFQTDLVDTNDDITYLPSTSVESLVEVENQDGLISNQEVNISFLKKYFLTSLKDVEPRAVIYKPCNRQGCIAEKKDFLSAASYEFFESSDLILESLDANLIRAACLRQVRAAKKVIHKGADVNTVKDNQTPLMIATEAGDTRFVAYLLTVPKININLRNILGQTPLLMAVRNGFDSIVRLLLKHNADVNLQDNMGKTALHVALFQQQTKLVKLLLAFGANFELPDCFGERPIYTATVKKPNLKCLKMLLKMGAMPDHITMSGVPLLSRSILNGTKFKIIETLVNYGASVNSQDVISKKTPLHFAALTNNLRVAEFLINKGADPTMKTTYNFTPLEEATLQRSFEVKFYLRELIETEDFQSKSQYTKINKFMRKRRESLI